MNECELYQELISRLVDGEISRKEYAVLDAHMENCAECSAMYAVFASLSDIIGSEAEPLPEDLHEDIMAGVRRSAMINRNRRRLSKPLRNSLAAAACAALVLFAARGLSPAEKAESTVVSRNEAVMMDMQQESRQEAAVRQPEAVPAEQPAEAQAPAAPAAPAATAATVRPTATPVPTEDIYLGGDEDIYAAPDNSASNAVVVTTPPAAIYVNTPTATASPEPAPEAVYTPAPVAEEAAPAAESAAPEAAPASMNPEAEQPAAYSEQPEAELTSQPEPEPTTESQPEPEPTETPTLPRRFFSFFGLARPAVELEPEPGQETETTAAGPVATETPAEETAPVETPSVEEAEEKRAEPVVKLESPEKLTKLEDMLDGEEAELPEEEAEEEYIFILAEPEESFEDYKIKVLVFEKEVYYIQYFAEDDYIVCLSKCSVEDFNKFMDGLTDKEKAALPSPSPSPVPSPSASPELPLESVAPDAETA